MMISSPAWAMNCSTGVVCGIGCTPAVPPLVIGDFCWMFCAPASIVCLELTPVARCRMVTAASNGRRRYFQLASGLESSWLAVSAIDQLKSGMFTHSGHGEVDAVRRAAPLNDRRIRHVDVGVKRAA